MDKAMRGRDILRRVCLVVLSVTALLLALETGYLSLTPNRDAPGHAAAPTAPQTGDSAAALWPRGVLISRADGHRRSALCDQTETERLFSPFAALLGEALGTAGAAEALSEADFRLGLTGEGLFVDLGAACPLGLLAGALGAKGRCADTAELLLLLPGVEGAELRYRRPDGSFARCATSTSSETLRARLNEGEGVEAVFAYEDPALSRLSPYLIVPAHRNAPPRIEAAVNPNPETLMRAFGMNSYVASGYREGDGTRVYIDDEKTLRIAADGTVRYRCDAAGRGGSSDEELAAYALRLAQEAVGALCGDARLRFVGLRREGELATVELDYAVQGVPVELAAGRAVVLRFRNGSLVSAQLLPRSFRASAEAETVPPMRFAAAIAAAGEGGGLRLCYLERGEGFRCLWVNG
ncbi:MAG: hypothetical protein IJG08_02180 [Oscillospiraceae bacterium]|nr:hypothetical protein [Oscillospiraceae bacterium]